MTFDPKATQQVIVDRMEADGVPPARAEAKGDRHMAGLALIQASERKGYVMALLAMLCVVLLVALDRLQSLWLLAFFCLPLAWGLAQSARGAVMLSSDVLKYMTPAELEQLGWFTRWVVGLAKTWKGTKVTNGGAP